MTTQELISYYQGLLIIQYATLPKAFETIEVFVTEMIADQIYNQVSEAFNLDTANGVQLDAIATYRGASRTLHGLVPGKSYFQFPFYDDPNADDDFGFAFYGDTPFWYFLSYQDEQSVTYTMNDAEFRQWIKYLAAYESSQVGLQDIDNLLVEFFGPNATVFDNLDMSILYVDTITDPNSILFTFANAFDKLPRPAGVKVNAIRSNTLEEFFGMNIMGSPVNPTIVGFGFYGAAVDGSFIMYP